MGLKVDIKECPRRLHPSLNRTSVGLKAAYITNTELLAHLPQSNQHGIERLLKCFVRIQQFIASIEPAWD